MMVYILFYAFLISAWVVLFFCSQFKRVELKHAAIGLATIAYTLTYETILGDWLGLYYYLNQQNSTLYIVLAGIFLYPVLNMIYVLFLPRDRKKLLSYTGIWIVAMLFFEYISVILRIVIFTGWRPIPWSIVTYAFTYLWINLLYGYLDKEFGKRLVR